MSLCASLDSLNRSAESIKTLYFAPSGIFTNALTLKPDLYKLMRDAHDYESSMYTINKDTQEIKRADGSESYLDLYPTEDDDHSRPTVKIPRVQIATTVEKEDSKIQSIVTKLNSENYSVDVLIEKVKNLVEANRSLLSNYSKITLSLDEKSRKYQDLHNEVEELEELIQRQKSHLSQMNSNINDEHILNLANKVDAKDLIAQEEQEIKELELLLMSKKKEDKEVRNSIVNNGDAN